MKKLYAIILSLGLIISPMPMLGNAHASGQSGGYLKVIFGMANGIVGGTILAKCTMGASQPSLALYFAGSLVYAAAEILGGKEKTKQIKFNSEKLDELQKIMVQGGDYQREALVAQLENEEANLKHAQKKLQWMNATKIIYTLAAVVAFIEFILSLPPPPAGIGILKTDVGGCSPNYALDLPLQAGIIGAYAGLQGYASGGLMGAGIAVAAPIIMEKLGVLGVFTSVQEFTIVALNLGLGRVAWFGAAALIVTKLTSELQTEIGKIQTRIAKIKAILQGMPGASNNLAEGDTPTTSGAGNGNGKDTPTKGRNYAIKNLPKPEPVGKHCFSSSGGATSYTEEGCKSSIKIVRPKLEGQFNIPTVSAGTNSSIDMAQAIADGDLGKADIEAGKLSNMAGRIDAIHNELMKKANEQLKLQGKKPIDYNDEINKKVAAFNDALNKKSPGSGNYSSADLDKPSMGEAKVSDSKPVDGAGDINAAKVNGDNTGAAGVDLAALDKAAGDASADQGAIDPNANQVASLSDSLDKFESTEGDISKERDVSIFKQVSNRYFLNYTRLFEKKKIDPPMAEPTP